MANVRGQNGLLIVGGAIQGTAVVKANITAGAVTCTITGGTLVGIIAVGDVFQLDGGVDRTVTGTLLVAGSNSVGGLAFTPAATALITAGVSVAFNSNSVAEVRTWSLDDVSAELIEDTVKGDSHKTFRPGIAGWSGSATAYLDYGDAKQKALIDEITSGTPDGAIATLVFFVEGGSDGAQKILYGAVVMNSMSISSPEGSALVEVSFNFQGSDALSLNWNA